MSFDYSGVLKASPKCSDRFGCAIFKQLRLQYGKESDSHVALAFHQPFNLIKRTKATSKLSLLNLQVKAKLTQTPMQDVNSPYISR